MGGKEHSILPDGEWEQQLEANIGPGKGFSKGKNILRKEPSRKEEAWGKKEGGRESKGRKERK